MLIISFPRTMDSNSPPSIFHVTLPSTLPRVTIASLLLPPQSVPLSPLRTIPREDNAEPVAARGGVQPATRTVASRNFALVNEECGVIARECADSYTSSVIVVLCVARRE